jgi:magnesium transporter
MLNAYSDREVVLEGLDASGARSQLSAATWIDMIEPSKEEEFAVEELLGIDVPSREEMRGVESSSQLYHDGNATVMTVRILSVSGRPSPALVATTFILTPQRLVTLRYGESTAFRTFVAKGLKEAGSFSSPEAVMSGLLEAIVERVAEILEGIGDELDQLSSKLFTQNDAITQGIANTDLHSVLKGIGSNGDLASRTRECLHSISRIMPALEIEQPSRRSEEIATRLITVHQDVKSLLDHAAFLTSKVQFLLDSALGLISIQQNAIIKIFSVAAVIFLPPTLIASIYGMNFEHIPELKWLLGYPWALGMMVVSAVLPYCYFKWKKWL